MSSYPRIAAKITGGFIEIRAKRGRARRKERKPDAAVTIP
jgi:hypothetical protein